MKNKILIVGSGAREHALGLAMKEHELLFTPGNPGTANIGTNYSYIEATQIEEIVELAKSEKVDLVVVGPEIPLSLGLTDELNKVGIKVLGPTKAAAQLESSKVFAKDFMSRHNIPTAKHYVFNNAKDAKKFVLSQQQPFVVKASGLAAGKGVIVPSTIKETLSAISFIMKKEYGKIILLEEILKGREVSYHIISNGINYTILPVSQDYKRLLDGNIGPNTGGMGAYAPVKLSNDVHQKIINEIIEPTLNGMNQEGNPFVGVLFIGLMIDGNQSKVIEYNVRFGDPESTVILPLYNGDWYALFKSVVDSNLNIKIMEAKGYSVSVVIAAKGYPNYANTSDLIYGDTSNVLHAGTAIVNNKLIVKSGRVLCANSYSDNFEDARLKAYQLVAAIAWSGSHFRMDIGFQNENKGV